MATDTNILLRRIANAFDGVPRGSGITLHQADEMDINWSRAKDEVNARRLDSDTRWQDVKAQWIEQFPSAYQFMDIDGLRYYLPAVMTWDLTKTSSNTAPADVVADKIMQNRQIDIIRQILTPQQRQAVAEWLLYRARRNYNPNREIAMLKKTLWWSDLSESTG